MHDFMAELEALLQAGAGWAVAIIFVITFAWSSYWPLQQTLPHPRQVGHRVRRMCGLAAAPC
jgi:hypothetical protein